MLSTRYFGGLYSLHCTVLYWPAASLLQDQVTDEEVEEDKKASEKTSKPIFFPVLVYLETSCSRYRIICLALTLMDADRPYSAESPTSEYDAGASSTRPRLSADIEHLRQLCQTYDQTRVVRILDDVVQGKVLNRTDSGEERWFEHYVPLITWQYLDGSGSCYFHCMLPVADRSMVQDNAKSWT